MGPESSRAALRPARFAGVTSFHALEAVGRGARGILEPAEAVQIIHEWATKLTGTFGLNVSATGSVPHGPALLVANHRSYVDIALIASQTPALFFAKAEIEAWPMLGAGARATHCIFVKREDTVSRARARVDLYDRLRAGVSVAIFPEGTTSRGPGLKSFHPGSFRVAMDAGVPVVPVSIFYPNRDIAFIEKETFVPHFLDRFTRSSLDAHISFGPAMTARDPLVLRDACHGWIASELARQEALKPEIVPLRRPHLVESRTRPTAALGAA